MDAAKEKNAAKPAKAGQKPILGVNDMACRMLRGSFQESALCSTEKAIGSCLLKKGTPEEYSLYYYQGGKFNEASAQSDCGDSKSGIHSRTAGEWIKI